ncbi:MAG: hypothetical protein C4320_05575 [Armatimonadota bacterium]
MNKFLFPSSSLGGRCGESAHKAPSVNSPSLKEFRRRVSEGAQFIALLLLLFGIGLRQSVFVTPEGVQCPTSAVHTRIEVVRTACGCPIRPGDDGFVQCRCSEKRAAAETGGYAAPAVIAAKFVFLVPDRPRTAKIVYVDTVTSFWRPETPDRPPTLG